METVSVTVAIEIPFRTGATAHKKKMMLQNTILKAFFSIVFCSFEEFSALNSFKRTGFVLGCENGDFKSLSRLVKSSILLIWDTRRNKLYGDQDGTGETSGCSCTCPLTGDLTSSACVCGCVVDGVSATAAT